MKTDIKNTALFSSHSIEEGSVANYSIEDVAYSDEYSIDIAKLDGQAQYILIVEDITTVIGASSEEQAVDVFVKNRVKQNYKGTAEYHTGEELELAKKKAMAILTGNYDAKILAGYYDLTEDITIGISKTDRASFSEMLVLLKEAVDLGQTLGDQKITTIDRTSKSLSYLNLRILLVKMGLYVKAIWDTQVDLAADIVAADTLTVLNALDLSL